MTSTFAYLLCFLFLMASFALIARFAARFGVETHRGEEADRVRRKWFTVSSYTAVAVFLVGILWFFFFRNPEPIAAYHILLPLPFCLNCVAVWLRTTRFAFSPQSPDSAAQEEGAAPAESALNRLLGEDGAKTTSYVKPTALPWTLPLNTLYAVSVQMAVFAGVFGRDLGESPFSLGAYLFLALCLTFVLLDRPPGKRRGFASTFLFLLVFAGIAAGLTYLLWPIVAAG